MRKFGIGNKITMYLKCRGITIEEETKIVAISNETIELEKDCESTWIFSRESGACLNDNTFLGIKRYISAKKLAKSLKK